MPIRAVVFDIGGVLEITPRLGLAAQWEQTFGLKPGQLDEKLAPIWEAGSLGKLTEAEVYASIGRALGVSDVQVIAYMEDNWREYLGTLNTELAHYFRALRPRYHTAIISNSFVGAREREQALYHFEEMCDFILYSHELGIAKPNPRIYERACERLGLLPREIVFVDDYEGNIDAARKFGMRGVLFQETRQAIQEINLLLEAAA